MAQQVGYFEDFNTPEREAEAYSEGPFVIVDAWGWRIECEVKGEKCPTMPDLSIYHLKDHWGFPEGKFNRMEDAASLCDRLNAQVKFGGIVLEGKSWRAKQSLTGCRTDCFWCKEG